MYIKVSPLLELSFVSVVVEYCEENLLDAFV
jgi:hypothetical protein